MAKSRRALKKAPVFRSEAEERAFWERTDSTEYVDWAVATPVRFPSLRPSSTAISVRLPDTLLTELKLLANERNVRGNRTPQGVSHGPRQGRAAARTAASGGLTNV